MERGSAQPTIGTLVRLARVLDGKVTALVAPFDKADLRALLPN